MVDISSATNGEGGDRFKARPGGHGQALGAGAYSVLGVS
jgi:hypothetical protein